MHLQRRHSSGKEFNSDIEKLVTTDENKKNKQNKGEVILFLVPVVMILLIFWGMRNASEYKQTMSTTEQFKMEQSELLLRLYHQKTQQLESGYKFNMGFQPKGPTTTSDVGLLDLSSLSESRTVSEEILKLDDHIKQLNKPSATAVVSKNINVALDLKEMMLISPVTVLLDDVSSLTPEKTKFLEILFKSLTINPEPKLVNLSKHPHHTEIVEYLQKYAGHQYGTPENEGSDNDDEETVTISDIPRLFVGGLPIGRFNDVINKYDSNELISHLKETGKGLISVN